LDAFRYRLVHDPPVSDHGKSQIKVEFFCQGFFSASVL
jgi:hypothetical protein